MDVTPELMRTVGAVGIAVTLVSLALSLRKAGAEVLIRPQLEMGRIVLGAGGAFVIGLVGSVTTQAFLAVVAIGLGLTVGFVQGRALTVTVRDGRRFARRNAVGIAVWFMSLVAMQAAGIVNRSGAFRLGQAAALFGVAVMAGVIIGREAGSGARPPGAARGGVAAAVLLATSAAGLLAVLGPGVDDAAASVGTPVAASGSIVAQGADDELVAAYEWTCEQTGGTFSLASGCSNGIQLTRLPDDPVDWMPGTDLGPVDIGSAGVLVENGNFAEDDPRRFSVGFELRGYTVFAPGGTADAAVSKAGAAESALSSFVYDPAALPDDTGTTDDGGTDPTLPGLPGTGGGFPGPPDTGDTGGTTDDPERSGITTDDAFAQSLAALITAVLMGVMSSMEASMVLSEAVMMARSGDRAGAVELIDERLRGGDLDHGPTTTFEPVDPGGGAPATTFEPIAPPPTFDPIGDPGGGDPGGSSGRSAPNTPREETGPTDTTGDGRPDRQRMDLDGDGDAETTFIDEDGDGIADRMEVDADGDGVPETTTWADGRTSAGDQTDPGAAGGGDDGRSSGGDDAGASQEDATEPSAADNGERGEGDAAGEDGDQAEVGAGEGEDDGTGGEDGNDGDGSAGGSGLQVGDQEIADIYERGLARGRSLDDLREDVAGLDRARGGDGQVGNPLDLDMRHTDAGPVPLTGAELAEYQGAQRELAGLLAQRERLDAEWQSHLERFEQWRQRNPVQAALDVWNAETRFQEQIDHHEEWIETWQEWQRGNRWRDAPDGSSYNDWFHSAESSGGPEQATEEIARHRRAKQSVERSRIDYMEAARDRASASEEGRALDAAQRELLDRRRELAGEINAARATVDRFHSYGQGRPLPGA